LRAEGEHPGPQVRLEVRCREQLDEQATQDRVVARRGARPRGDRIERIGGRSAIADLLEFGRPRVVGVFDGVGEEGRARREVVGDDRGRAAEASCDGADRDGVDALRLGDGDRRDRDLPEAFLDVDIDGNDRRLDDRFQGVGGCWVRPPWRSGSMPIPR
jgi:hypothetical protein